jgi:hypothetical protein
VVEAGFVSGHDFSRAANELNQRGALAPEGPKEGTQPEGHG